MPKVSAEQAQEEESTLKETGSAWQYRHLVLGAIGIFVYVGAEVAIGSFLVSFFAEPTIAGLEESEAAKYIAYYWGGRWLGALLAHWLCKKYRQVRSYFLTRWCR